jgi:hypothetical protein
MTAHRFFKVDVCAIASFPDRKTIIKPENRRLNSSIKKFKYESPAGITIVKNTAILS